MPEAIKLIECPRDAWQGLKGQIPADLKTNYLQALISAGFKHIDAVSFVSPNAVPQMADSEEVLKELDPPDDVEIIGIVVNEKGAQRAIATEAVPHFDVNGVYLTILKGVPTPAGNAEPARFPLFALSVDDLDVMVSRLEKQHVEMPWGIENNAASRWIMFQDPAGNLIELVQFGG